MADKIKQLKHGNDKIFPVTVTNAIYTPAGTTLDDQLAGIGNAGNSASLKHLTEWNVSALNNNTQYATLEAAVAALTTIFEASNLDLFQGLKLSYVGTDDVTYTYIYDGAAWEVVNPFTTDEKTKLAQLTQSSDMLWYGVETPLMQASPDMTRIGYMDNHRILPYHTRIRPCIVNDDRTINYYLDNNDIRRKADGTPSALDGTDGQLMIYYPAGYHLLNRGETKEVWAVGLSPFSYDNVQAEYVPAFVVSMDWATVQRTSNKLACVINDTSDFAGSGSGATAGGIGYARTAVSNYNYTQYARNRGAGWINSFAFFELIKTSLMYIEYATHQFHKAINATLSPQGYTQGGLGEGPWNWSGANWSLYNGYYPVVKIGEVQLNLCEVGNTGGTGVYTKVFQVTPEQTYTTKFPCWRWCSNLYAHLWRWDAGIDIDMHPDASDTPISTAYMTKNPESVLATNNDDFSFIEKYERLGDLTRTAGYSKQLIRGSTYQAIGGGGSTTYACAYHWTTLPTTARERRGFHSGANLHLGGAALRASAISIYRPSGASANIGSGLAAYVVE